MSINAALAMGDIVKRKIEEEIHKHQHPDDIEEGDENEGSGADNSSGAVGGGDDDEEEEDNEGKASRLQHDWPSE